MNAEVAEEALEEGRVALFQLERQLKERDEILNHDNHSEGSTSRQSSILERRLLDKIPRNTRLNNRLESLGLTVEELDDRGLLDGGGAVPTYYTSMKQKNRRHMELQSRSHRLLERGKETTTKLLNSLHHMIRVLHKKGLPLAAYCLQLDATRRGTINKRNFMQMLMSLGLPFSSKDLSEIVNHYVIASTEKVNYQSFLKDTRLPQNGADEISNGKPINIRKYSSILSDIKKLLLETLEKLNKHPDDLYRTFARWDSLGTGTVTATQFLRVLSRMHVDLSDQDQDFLVELLDSNGEGRIDFESLLSFCFAGMNDDRGNGQNTWTSGSVSVDDNVIEILSAEGNTSELKSFASINRRPHTATVTRPFQSSANNQSNQIEESMMDKRQIYNGNKSPGKSIRPLTASARVSSPSTDVLSESKGPSLNAIDDAMYVRDMPDDVIDGEERYMDPVSSTIVRNPRHGIDGMIQNNKANAKANKIERVIDIGDTSINDTTLMTNDQDEYFFGTPKAIPSINAREGHWNMNSVDGWTDASLSSYSAGHDMKTWASPNKAAAYNYTNQFYDSTEFGSPTVTKNFYPGNNQPNFPPIVEQAEGNDLSVSSVVASSVQSEKERSVKEPFEHLHLLANQILSTMREMIIARYKRGRSLREIFQHFDRSRKGYFDAGDFVRATSDLRIETTDKVASIAINQIAIDDYDKVSFGEFKVYVMDTDHKLLVISVQEQLAQLLELQGRKYQSWMIEKFWEEENQLTGRGAAARNNGVVSTQAFITGIQKVGASLTSAEIGRLVDRFDVDGNGVISITRFIRMIQNSNAWHSTEKVLAYQDEATEEAIILRRAIADGSAAQLGYPDISEEIISMCEYLGIRVMTERSMIWIAVDALKAPLPVSWTAETDNTGRTYFHNIVTNQSKWEHPLDPHFRKLRDQCRESQTADGDIIDLEDLDRIESNLDKQSIEEKKTAATNGQTTIGKHTNGRKVYNPQEKSPTQINNNDYLINLEHRPGSAVNPPRKSVTKNSSAGVSNGRPLSAPQNLVKKDPTSGSTPVACSKTKETGPPKIYIQSKQIIEQIYNSPYLKYQEVGAELRSGNGINSGNRNPGLNAYASTLGTEKSSRPSSAKRTRGSGEYNNGAGGNGSRPISSGSKTVNRLRNTTNPMSERNAKLAEMFDDNLLNKLDIVIGNTR